MKKIFIYSGEFRTFDKCLANHVEMLGQPFAIRWEDTEFNDFNVKIDESRKAPECNPNNVLRMWERRSFVKLYNNDIKPEIICLLRPDILISNKIDFSLLDINKNNIYIPSGGDYRDGINDQMAIGSRSIINTYCSLYRWWESYYQKGVLFHAETMLKHHLERFEIDVKRLPTEVTILR